MCSLADLVFSFKTPNFNPKPSTVKSAVKRLLVTRHCSLAAWGVIYVQTLAQPFILELASAENIAKWLWRAFLLAFFAKISAAWANRELLAAAPRCWAAKEAKTSAAAAIAGGIGPAQWCPSLAATIMQKAICCDSKEPQPWEVALVGQTKPPLHIAPDLF